MVSSSNETGVPPLFVDLDGSLIATDSLWESLVRLLKSKPLLVFLFPVWLAKGKANFKRKIADHAIPDAALLPYRTSVLEHIRKRKEQGGSVVLATAADNRIANAVANHLGIFSKVLASDGETNLSGTRKLAAIREMSGSDFEYIGDAWVDVPIWQAAKRATIVDGPQRLLKQLESEMPVEKLGNRGGLSAKVIIRAMRCHQWIKNILIFVPMLLAHQVSTFSTWLTSVFAFFSFSLVASSVYVLNDILDVESDRSHPQKRKRPFASGQIQIKSGVVLGLILLVCGIGTAFLLVSTQFAWLAVLYLAMTLAYSFYFKRQPIIDLLILAWFYTHRVVLGGAAVEVAISPWLLGFSIFFFMSLAMLKRFADLIELDRFGQTEARGRSYNSEDLPLFRSMGPATACTSVFVLAMYITSESTVKLYRHPEFLWFICPILFYWIMRVWFVANRGQLHYDPIVFALRDKISHVVAVVVGLIIVLAAVELPWL